MQVKYEGSAVQIEKAEEDLNIFQAFVKLLLKIIRSDTYLPIQTIGVFPDCSSTSTNIHPFMCFSKKEFDSLNESMEKLGENFITEVLFLSFRYHEH